MKPTAFPGIRVVTALFLLHFASSGLSATVEPPEFLTGLRAPTAEEKALLEKTALRLFAPTKSAEELPASVKNIEFLPVVGRQTLPNCGAFAPTYYMKTYQEARKRGWIRPSTTDRIMSPGIAYVFGQSTVYGASIHGSITVMCETGIVPLSLLADSYTYDLTVFPSAALLLEAMPYRAGQPVYFNPGPDEGFLALKEWLAGGDLAVFSLGISQATYDYGREENVPDVDNDVIYGRGGAHLGNHALTLIGYDDNKTYNNGTEDKQGAFLAVNSWGTGWGILDPDFGSRGFLWIGYDDFRARAGDPLSMTVRENLLPKWVGLFEYEHLHSPQVGMNFYGGVNSDFKERHDPDAPFGVPEAEWKVRWPPANPSIHASYDPSRPLVVDFTGDGGELPEAFLWRITNVGHISGLPHPGLRGMAHTLRLYRYQDLKEAHAGPLFLSGTENIWRIVPLDQIDAPYIEAEGLPVETKILKEEPDFYFTDIAFGFYNSGEDILTSPVVQGAAFFADLNGNGRQDLFVTGSGVTDIYENLGGTFRKIENHGIPPLYFAAAAAGDFNRDGLPDIALFGVSDGKKITRIYRNLGDFRFEDIEAGLPVVNVGAMAWGDYDNDGLEDLAFWGTEGDSPPYINRMCVYRNRGDGTFEPAAFELPVQKLTLAWLDVNADGFLDLCVGGSAFLNQGDGTLATTGIGPGGEGVWADFTGNGLPDFAQATTVRVSGKIWHQVHFHRNLGNAELQYTGNFINDVKEPDLAAADYNNDGLMDLIASHQITMGDNIWTGPDTPRATSAFRQMPDGKFHNAGFDFLGTYKGLQGYQGSLALADVDGDGDLDLLTTGYIQTKDKSWTVGSRFYRNLFAQSPFENRANTPPTPPVNLEARHDDSMGLTVFLWDHGTDAQTPQAGLAYNVRVGTWHGGVNIVSPASCAPVTPVLRYYRIAPDQPGLILRNLPPGQYYWSVRTVDGGRMASEWSPEHSFSLLDGYVVEDINGDGVLDVADVVQFSRMVSLHRQFIPLHYDFNKDGRISQADVRTLAKIILSSEEFFPGEYTIGPEGGEITLDGLEISVPPGAFAQPAVLTIERTNTKGAYEHEEAPEVYEITGLPLITDASWFITLRPAGSEPEMPLVLLGEESFAFEYSDTDMRYRYEEPEILPDGRYRVEIPRLENPEKLLRLYGTNTYTFNVGYLNLAGIAKYAGPRFAIFFPKSYIGDPIENLMGGFEEAYQKIKDDFGFSYAARTRWPLDVYVKKLPPGMDGAMISTVRGINYGYIEINLPMLDNYDKARATACHEFFHVVQGMYDPAGRIRQATRRTYPRYWLDEAMSTWAEELVVSDPANYIPSTYIDNVSAPYLGVAHGLLGDSSSAPEYGYGMAPLIKYLMDTGRTGAPLAFYAETLSGSEPIRALDNAVTDLPLRIWYDDFFRQLVESKIYPYSSADIARIVTSERLFILEPPAANPVSWKRFQVSLTDLSAGPCMLGFRTTYPEPPPDSIFVLRFEGDPFLGLQVFRVPRTDAATRVASAFTTNEVKFGAIPNALNYKNTESRLLVLVSNTSADSPYTEKREGTLSFGLARPGPITLQENSSSLDVFNQLFPNFTGSGSIQVEAFSDLTESLGLPFHYVQAAVWGNEPLQIAISYQADIESLTHTWQEGADTITLSTTGIQTYSISWDEGGVTQFVTSVTGEFTMFPSAYLRQEGKVVYVVKAVFPMVYQENGVFRYTWDQEWPLLIFNADIP